MLSNSIEIDRVVATGEMGDMGEKGGVGGCSTSLVEVGVFAARGSGVEISG
jgi:hypothetical protein